MQCRAASIWLVLSRLTGLDTTPIIIPFRDFATANHRRLPYLEQRPALRSASSKRLIMSWWGQEVNVWRLGKRRESKHNDTSSPEPSEEIERTLVLKLLLKVCVPSQFFKVVGLTKVTPDRRKHIRCQPCCRR